MAPFLTSICVALALTIPAQEPLGGLSEYTEEARETWQVPGLAVTVVHGDAVVFSRGFGTREVGGTDPVDEHTLFAIGSASKAFTALGVALLVDEERVAWDDRATEHLPGFELYDPWVTRELTVRDLLCHRAGLPRGDFLWYGSELGRDEVLRRVRHLEPRSSFRSLFGYQNILYLAAGQMIARLEERAWEDSLRARILEPLGMTETLTSTRQLEGRPNVATPHAWRDEGAVAVPWRNLDNIAPAGSILSTVSDLSRWLRLQLGAGSFEGSRLLSETAHAETHTPQTVIRREGRWVAMTPAANFVAYGLGWFLHDYRGEKIVQHGGHIDGMAALVALMPGRDVGVAVLTNLDHTDLKTALAFRVFDCYLEGEPRDRATELFAGEQARRAAPARQAEARAATRKSGTRPSSALEDYAGTYEHEMFGPVEVRFEDGRLHLRFGPPFEATLEHWHHDVFLARWTDRQLGEALVQFRLDGLGRVGTVEVEGLGEWHRAER